MIMFSSYHVFISTQPGACFHRELEATLRDLHHLAEALLVVKTDQYHGDGAGRLHVHHLGGEGAPAPLDNGDFASKRRSIQERPARLARLVVSRDERRHSSHPTHTCTHLLARNGKANSIFPCNDFMCP
jgi:hypothetical protein